MSARHVVVNDAQTADRRAPGDVVLDLDRLMAALGGAGPHVRHVALRALRGAREAAVRLREDVTVWDVRPTTTSAPTTGGEIP
ncbi:hypothetical protein [Isoptericola nanjingensis]|uniref:hypothetical protein n=1 Tax=Isoptericola nanjingensis TaxID=903413 RepID=UPI003D2192A3